MWAQHGMNLNSNFFSITPSLTREGNNKVNTCNLYFNHCMSIIFTVLTLCHSEMPLQWNKSYKKLHILCHIKIYCIFAVWHMVFTTSSGNVGLRTLILYCAGQGFWHMSAGQRIIYHYPQYPTYVHPLPNLNKAHKNSTFPTLTTNKIIQWVSVH
jgi:hypothetical protein